MSDAGLTAEVPAPRSLARNAVHLVLGQGISTALSVIVTALLARALGAGDFGIFYLGTTVTAFAYVFVEWGQPTYLPREVAHRRDEATRLLGSALAFRAGVAVVVLGATALLTRLLGYDQRTQTAIALMIVTYLPRSWGLAFGVTFRGLERMDYDALGNALTGFFSALLLVPVLVLGGGLHAAIWTQGAAGVLTLAGYFALLHRLGVGRLSVSLSTLRALFFEGAALVSLAIFIVTHSYLDAILLSKLAPATAVGWYAAGNRFIGTLLIPATILGSALYPRLSRLFHQDPPQFAGTLRSALRPLLWLGALVMVGTWLFADLAVAIVFGRTGYEPAVVILKAAAPGLFFTFLTMILGATLLAARRQKRLAVAKFGALIVAVVLDALLIPVCQARFGNGGLGVSLSVTLSEFFMLLWILKLCPPGLIDRRTAGQMVKAGAATVASLAVAGLFGRFAGPWNVVAGLAAFGALSVLLGMVSGRDLEILRDAVRWKQPGNAA